VCMRGWETVDASEVTRWRGSSGQVPDRVGRNTCLGTGGGAASICVLVHRSIFLEPVAYDSTNV